MSTIAEVADAVACGASRGVILLLSDFDGTLVEFAVDPDTVKLPARRRALLETLAARPAVAAGIVSGRRLWDLRDRVGIAGPLVLAGLHGLEIEGPGARFLHPGAAAAREALAALRPALAAAVRDLAGVFVEDKDLSLALHVRAADPEIRERAERILKATAGSALARGELRLLAGDKVFELLPNVTWSKGDAVGWIRGHVEKQRGQAVWPVYLGDDWTDEPAFETIGDDGVAVVVGTRPSRAAFRLADPLEVEALLAELVARNVGVESPAR